MKQRLIINRGSSFNYYRKQAHLSFRRKLLAIGSATVMVLAALAVVLFPTSNQLASALSIQSLSQTSGSTAGGNEITINGNGYQKAVPDGVKDVKEAGIATLMLTTSNRLLISLWQAISDRPGYYSFDANKFVDITAMAKLQTGEYIKGIGVKGIAITSNGRVLQVQCSVGNHVVSVKDVVDITEMLSIPAGDMITDITGDQFNYLVTKNGRLIIQTSSSANQNYPGDLTKIKFADYTNVINLGAGDRVVEGSSMLFLTQSGRVFKYGKENTNDKYHFIELTSKFGDRVIDIEGTGNCPTDPSNNCHYFARTANGDVYAWGSNLRGQLGLGEMDSGRVDPEKINFNFDGKVVDMQAGHHGSMLVTDRGTLYYMGQNGDKGEAYVTPYGETINESVLSGQGNPGHNVKVPTELKATQGKRVGRAYMVGAYTGLESGSPVLLAMQNGTIAQCGYVWGTFSNSIASSKLYPVDLGKVNISNVKSIRFGDREAKFQVVDNKTISVTVPANVKPGRVDITITDNDGNAYTLKNGYRYLADVPVTKPNKHVIPTAPNTGTRR